VRVEDEWGKPWRVDGGDPAAPLVNKLRRHLPGLDYVVLPWHSLRTGELSEPARSAPDYIAGVRLADCIAVLKGAP
jgi:hypothetical protein